MPTFAYAGRTRAGQNVTGDRGHAFVPLGQVADIRIVGGPPMVRNEGGLLVGYVFVDVDPARGDLGGYVSEAKRVVSVAVRDHTLQIPQGHFLKWAGQYEELEKMTDRMRIVIPDSSGTIETNRNPPRDMSRIMAEQTGSVPQTGTNSASSFARRRTHLRLF